METVFFYSLMVVYAAFYAIVTTGKEDKEASSLSMRYPLLGVFSFFGLMAVAYYLLKMADRGDVGMLNTYLGTLLFFVSYLITRHIYHARK